MMSVSLALVATPYRNKSDLKLIVYDIDTIIHLNLPPTPDRQEDLSTATGTILL